MKITLAPSQDQHGLAWPHAAVSIDMPDDDMDLSRVLESLVIPALIAWGFHPKNVAAHIEVGESNDRLEDDQEED